MYNNRFQYGGENNVWVVQLLKKARNISINTPRDSFISKCRRRFWKIATPIIERVFFIWALINHNVFIFGARTSFFEDNRDFAHFKVFWKKRSFAFFMVQIAVHLILMVLFIVYPLKN